MVCQVKSVDKGACQIIIGVLILLNMAVTVVTMETLQSVSVTNVSAKMKYSGQTNHVIVYGGNTLWHMGEDAQDLSNIVTFLGTM